MILHMKTPMKTGVCEVAKCSEPARGYKTPLLCARHRHRRQAKNPIAEERGTIRQCTGPECDRQARTLGMCETHYEQMRRTGETWPIKTATGRYTTQAGYVCVYVPERADAPLNGWMMEHRMVMSDFLGRRLRRKENVHHRNGVRHDNRLENLELWVTSQPSGQRPEDLCIWAAMILKQYESDAKRLRTIKRTRRLRRRSIASRVDRVTA